MDLKIIRANKNHIEGVSILFDFYRQFYKYQKDLKNSKNYIHERIINEESIIFIATDNVKIERAVSRMGYKVIMTSKKCLTGTDRLAEVSKKIKADIIEKYRKLGIGRKLMNKSKEFAINNKFSRIELSTSIDNYDAQKLYESLDYIRDKEYYNYDLNF